MYTIDYLDDKKIWMTTFNGLIDEHVAYKYVNEILIFDQLPLNFRLLQDFTKADFLLNKEVLLNTASIVKSKIARFNSIKVASVHNKTIGTAYSLILATLVQTSWFHHKTFTTKRAAEDWLQIN